MKTVMPLLATSTGLVTHLTQPGAALETGDALCAVEVEDPSSVKVSQPFSGEFTKIESRKLTGALKHDSALVKFTVNTAGIHQLLAGYDFNKTADPVTPLLEVLGTMELALDEFSETKQAVSSRASKAALTELASIEEFIQSAMVTDDGTDVVSVAVKRVRDLIDEHEVRHLGLVARRAEGEELAEGGDVVDARVGARIGNEHQAIGKGHGDAVGHDSLPFLYAPRLPRAAPSRQR